MANGNLLTMIGNHRAEEVDMLGNVVSRWHASRHPNPEANAEVPDGSIPVATETFHHDIQEMPSGNLLVLSTEMRRIADYPTVVGDDTAPKATANVIGDIVVEFARDGSIVNEWKLMDLLDPQRLGYESLGPVWDQWAYPDVEGGTKDESPDIKVGRSQRTGTTCAVSPAHLSSSNNYRLNTLRRLLAAAEQAPQPERGLRRRPSTEARKYCSGRSQKNP